MRRLDDLVGALTDGNGYSLTEFNVGRDGISAALDRFEAELTQKTPSIPEANLIRARSLVADKEMLVAQANLDLARGGEWRCDYAAMLGQIAAEIEALLKTP